MTKNIRPSIEQIFALSSDLADVQESRCDEELLVLAERTLVLAREVRELYDTFPHFPGGDAASRVHIERLTLREREMRALLRRASKLRAHNPTYS